MLMLPRQKPAPPMRLPDRRFRAAVVGLGKQAQEDHIPALISSEETDLVAVCDLDARQINAIHERFAVPQYRDVTRMLDETAPDFVIIAVPHHVGTEIVTTAAKAGVHVMKEKPFATNAAEARNLAELCADSGIELMVTLQRRFNPIYTTFHQLRDQIGDIFYIEGTYTMNVDPAVGWRASTAKAGGGCIIDMGYHMVDMLLWYFGLPDKVCAQYSASARPDLDYDAEDTASISFSYNNGPFGTLLLSRCISPKTERLRTFGTRGSVELERGRIQRKSLTGDTVESLAREQAWPSAATAQIDYFCRVLRGERNNDSGPAAHLARAAFVEACYASRDTSTAINPKEYLA